MVFWLHYTYEGERAYLRLGSLSLLSERHLIKSWGAVGTIKGGLLCYYWGWEPILSSRGLYLMSTSSLENRLESDTEHPSEKQFHYIGSYIHSVSVGDVDQCMIGLVVSSSCCWRKTLLTRTPQAPLSSFMWSVVFWSLIIVSEMSDCLGCSRNSLSSRWVFLRSAVSFCKVLDSKMPPYGRKSRRNVWIRWRIVRKTIDCPRLSVVRVREMIPSYVIRIAIALDVWRGDGSRSASK